MNGNGNGKKPAITEVAPHTPARKSLLKATGKYAAAMTGAELKADIRRDKRLLAKKKK